MVLFFAVVLVAVYFLSNPQFLIIYLAKRNPDVLFFAPTEEKVISLTIDDGPDSVVTPQILDTLADFKVAATFFIIGERVQGNENMLRRMIEEGHELGNHLMSDSPSIRLSSSEFDRQFNKTDSLLSEFANIRWMRPGSGWFNARVLRQIDAYGYRCALGSVYPYDAQLPFASFASSFILRNAFPGSVIILHDGPGRGRTVEVLRRIIPELRERGYRFVTLSELSSFSG